MARKQADEGWPWYAWPLAALLLGAMIWQAWQAWRAYQILQSPVGQLASELERRKLPLEEAAGVLDQIWALVDSARRRTAEDGT